MGNGSEREKLLRQAMNSELTNVQILPHQSYAIMPKAYAATDLAYVPQAMGTSNDGVPSKVYRILAMGRPVLACTDRESDLALLVEHAGAGFVVTSGAPDALAAAIRTAADNPEACRVRGARGRVHVVENYRRELVSESYSQLVKRVVGVPVG
jgi:colanic acid biosynthesis glycosyl transferase WcaI